MTEQERKDIVLAFQQLDTVVNALEMTVAEANSLTRALDAVKVAIQKILPPLSQSSNA